MCTISDTDLDRFDTVGDPTLDAMALDVFEHDATYAGGQFLSLAGLVGQWKPRSSTAKLPATMARFLDADAPLPNWIDLEAVRRAQEFYGESSQAGEVVLASFSLPILYIHPGISATLMGSGRLVLQVRSRLADTLAFVEEVMKPGSLEAGGTCSGWARKIRLTHAIGRIIATKLASHGPKPPASSQLAASVTVHPYAFLKEKVLAHQPDFVPMSQAQLAFVLQTFGWAMIKGLRDLGIRMSPSQQHEHLHCWASIGFFLGIDEHLLPGGPLVPPEEGKAVFERICSRLLANATAEARKQLETPFANVGDPLDKSPMLEGGRILTGALLPVLRDVLRSCVPQPFRRWVLRFIWLDAALQSLPDTVLRRFMGSPAAHALHVGRAPLLHWVVGYLAQSLINFTAWRPPKAAPLALAINSSEITMERGLF